MMFGVAVFASFMLVASAMRPEHVVQQYVKKLPLCFNWGHVLFIKEHVDDNIAKKLQIWLDSWILSGYKIQARPVLQKIKNTKLYQNSAEVIAEEVWLYRYINLRTKKEALPLSKIKYLIKYQLKRRNNKWKIKSIEILKEVNYGGGENIGSY